MSTTWTTAKVRTCTKGKCDVEISYNSIGKETDPCVLLVMGLNNQGLSWDIGFCEAIANKGYRVIRFDNRCIGYSTKFDHMPAAAIWKGLAPGLFGVKAPFTLLDMADDAVALLAHLNIQAAHWVGASMGGMICQVAGIDRPERVLSMTLIMTTSGSKLGAFQPPWWVRLSFLGKPKSQSNEDIMEYKINFSRKVMHYGCDFDDAWIRPRAKASVERSSYNGVLRQMWAILLAPVRDEALKKLNIPTTVIHGMTDVMVPVNNGVHLASLIDNSKLVLLENMSHCLPNWHMGTIASEIDGLAQRAGELTKN